MKAQQHILEFFMALSSGLIAFSSAAYAGVIMPLALLAGVFGFIAGFLFAELQQQKREQWMR